MEINPLHEHTHELIADAYIKIAKFDLALSHHLKAKEINPSNYLNYYLLGSDYLWSGNKGDASSNFLKAIEFNPKYCQSYYGLSRVKKIAPYEPIFSDVSKFINDESIIKNDRVYLNFFMANQTPNFLQNNNNINPNINNNMQQNNNFDLFNFNNNQNQQKNPWSFFRMDEGRRAIHRLS